LWVAKTASAREIVDLAGGVIDALGDVCRAFYPVLTRKSIHDVEQLSPELQALEMTSSPQ
jgi:hypothetical protein